MTSGAYRTSVLVSSRDARWADRQAECIVGSDRIAFQLEISGEIVQLQMVEVRSVKYYPDFGRTMFKKGEPVVVLETIGRNSHSWYIYTPNAKELASRIQNAIMPS